MCSFPKMSIISLPCDAPAEIARSEILIFDRAKRDKLKVKADLFKDQMLRIMTARSLAKMRDDDYLLPLWLSETPHKLYFLRTSRDLKRVDACSADTQAPG